MARYEAMLGMPEPWHTFASIAIPKGISLPDVAETFVHVFSSPTARPSNIDERLIPMGDLYPAHKLD